MEDQRDARSGRVRPGTQSDERLKERARALPGEAGFATEFVGYETTDGETTIGAVTAKKGACW